MPYTGKLDAFDSSTEDWNTYIEWVEQFFSVNGIEQEKYIPVLLSKMGGKAYGLLHNLTAPDKSATKGYNEIVKVMQEHLPPKPLLIAQRFRFHNRIGSKKRQYRLMLLNSKGCLNIASSALDWMIHS